MTSDPPRPPRRPRYQGTHPRRFEEKYKELDPLRYAAEQAKVRARGHTPAGTHVPIMVAEILQVLDPRPGQAGLDATLGYGGHAQELLARILPGGHLTGLDVDPLELPRTEARLRALGHGEDVLTVRRMNFAGLPGLLPGLGAGLDFILADLGVSSMQIDNPARGFTFRADGPLDLRLNPRRGQPASALLASLGRDELADLLRDHADEPHAEALAQALHERPATTTRELAGVVRAVLAGLAPGPDPRLELRRCLQRVLQALRIAVNDEFGVLEAFLDALPRALAPAGRVAILSFHSGEDRRVKKAFQAGLRAGLYAAVAEEPQRAGAQERRDNPRSSSAKLRWAVRPG